MGLIKSDQLPDPDQLADGFVDATLPLSDSDILMVFQNGVWKKVAKSEIGGGSSYLVYNVVLAQVGTSAPTQRDFQNDFGGTLWGRSEPGAYSYLTDMDWDENSIQIPGLLLRDTGDSLQSQVMPIYEQGGGSEIGHYQIATERNAGGKLEIFLSVFNTDFEFTDISSLAYDYLFYLPEIRLWP